MSSADDIRCLCCRKRVNFITVEPEFYCKKCVRKKEIHNCTKKIVPIKWYHKLNQNNLEVQNNIDLCITKIKTIIYGDKDKHLRMLNERVKGIKRIINNLKLIRDSKIKLKNAIILKRREIESKTKANIDRLNDIKRGSSLSQTLIAKTTKIQRYLNEIQCLFVKEIFQILPIRFSKYGQDSIAGFPVSIDLSDCPTLEPNDETSSAIFMLIILTTSILFILDLHYSSMNFRDFAVVTLCRLQQPLKRDEIMSVYEMIVKLVHHILQATLYRLDPEQTLPQSLNSSSGDAVRNYPLKNLALFNDNLKSALVMDSLSNPYMLELPNMFVNGRLDDHCNCARADDINGLSQTTNSHDFVEISSNMPLCESTIDYNHTDPQDWFKWVKKSFGK